MLVFRRGRHRRGPWAVAALREAVEGQREADRRAHLRSLRRPAVPAAPIYLGTTLQHVQFYGVPADPDDRIAMVATLWLPSDDEPELPYLPALAGGLPPMSDEAPTGPISKELTA